MKEKQVQNSILLNKIDQLETGDFANLLNVFTVLIGIESRINKGCDKYAKQNPSRKIC